MIWSLKVRGSTIVEVVVAMVICALIFGLASGVYIRTYQSTPSQLKIKAKWLIEQEYHNMLQSNAFEPWTKDQGELVMSCTVSSFNEQLQMVELRVMDKNGKMLASTKYIEFKQR